MIDYVIYGDTDSAFTNIERWIEQQGLLDIFNALSENEQIHWIKKIARCMENYVNKMSYNMTQRKMLNSAETGIKISFKSEVVFKAGFWIAKKKYFLYKIDNEGVRPEEPLSVTGLETVRSDTPIAIKPYLKQIMVDILLNSSDEELYNKISQYKAELKAAAPDKIAQNIGIRNVNEYIVAGDSYKKGTPRHIKAAIALKTLIKSLNLEDVVEDIRDADKAKVVYVKPNRYNIESLAFNKWVNQFNENDIEIDYDKMIYKLFTKKVEMFLEPMNKMHLLSDNLKLIDEFFI